VVPDAANRLPWGRFISWPGGAAAVFADLCDLEILTVVTAGGGTLGVVTKRVDTLECRAVYVSWEDGRSFRYTDDPVVNNPQVEVVGRLTSKEYWSAVVAGVKTALAKQKQGVAASERSRVVTLE
jgi:hypothetical protein